jgi:hypothetical protein
MTKITTNGKEFLMYGEVLWTIRLMVPQYSTNGEEKDNPENFIEVLEGLSSKINDVEQELSDSTPEGYYVKIEQGVTYDA